MTPASNPYDGLIEPCPFCGGAIEVERDEIDACYHHANGGPRCMLHGLHFGEEEVALWNNRPALSRLTRDVEELQALISEESIERLATDIAIACVDCRPEIKEARHRAMVRLGERLRKPLPNDLNRIDATLTRLSRPTDLGAAEKVSAA